MSNISKKVSWEIIKKSVLPVFLFSSLIASYINYKLNIKPIIPENIHLQLKKYIATIFILCIAFFVHSLFSAIIDWYKENIAIKTASRLDDKLAPIVGRTVKVIIWIIALLVILPFYGVDISALVTMLGVSSLAIALAAQDTIANIIAGFMIMVDSPFHVGDKIKIPSGEVVEVLDIGVRRSQFLAEDKAIIIVPNLDLSKSKIVNYTYGEERAR
ncbi:MAG: mechanosensitive ion channel domain-containing protein [Candidatus Omnitrophota bacterium]